MEKNTRAKLLEIAEEKQIKHDPSHDFQHALRVLNLVEMIGKKEKANMDILVPAALFHDIVVYQKNSHESKNETEESAKIAANAITRLPGYTEEVIAAVVTCIRQCSFSKGIMPEMLESKIL